MSRLRLSDRRTLAGAAALVAALALLGAAARAYSTFCGKHLAKEATFWINPNFSDASAGSSSSQVAALTAAAATWTDNGGADFRWNYGGTTSTHTINTADGVNAIFAIPNNGGSVLAETFCSSGPGGGITGFDIQFYDGDKTWASGTPGGAEFDIQGVACHELGHALGLGHTSVGGATMYPSTGPGRTDLRSIETDDRAGIQSIYGVASDPPGLTGVNPATGPIRGGNDVVLSGFNFKAGASVTFGAAPATVISVPDSSTINVRVPAGPSFSTVSITVTQAGGSDTLAAAYTYGENPVEVSFSGTPRLGSSVSFTVYGPPLADYGLALNRNQGPTTVKGLTLCWARDASLVTIGTSFQGRTPHSGPLSPTGQITMPYVVPSDPTLVFSTLYVQGVVDTDPGAGKTFALTNCLNLTVFP